MAKLRNYFATWLRKPQLFAYKLIKIVSRQIVSAFCGKLVDIVLVMVLTTASSVYLNLKGSPYPEMAISAELDHCKWEIIPCQIR